MYEVLVTVTVKTERRNDFETLIQKLTANTLAKDAGCERYEWYRSEESATYLLLERWTDEAAILAHSRAEHFLNFQPRLKECIESDFTVTKIVRAA